jgi:glycosyltransferase involved in cell wall biosynthesis
MSKESKILFISTNQIWSGSEELWYNTAIELIKKNYSVSIAVDYKNNKIYEARDKLKFYYKLSNSFSLFQRIINKIKSFNPPEYFQLGEKIKFLNPKLIVVSQGGTIESLQMFELFIELQIPFVIITQLATKTHLLRLNASNHQRYIHVYEKSIKNYFVSLNNLKLNESMLGYTSSNSEVIFNPYRFNKFVESYPTLNEGFQIAFVGRIEFYHKGIDLLLEVIGAIKWQERNVSFNFYGNGPHELLLKKTLHNLKIKNVYIHGFTDDVVSIWNYNHAFILTSRMEGQSLSLIEALMCNRVAIVTNVGGASEIIDDNITGFVANEASVSAIDESLERAWNRRFDWEQIGQIAKENLTQRIPEDAVLYFTDKLETLIRRLQIQTKK